LHTAIPQSLLQVGGELPAHRIEARAALRRSLPACTGAQHGVYLVFENGQARTATCLVRVARVGTHALTATSRTMLWNRLAQPCGQVSGRNPGGGSHRDSVLGRHVGYALLATGSWPADVQRSWPIQRADSGQKAAEEPLERAVIAYIGAMPLLWLAVPDRSQHPTIESNAAAAFPAHRGIDAVSPNWLGRNATNLKVRTSGLWNSNHVTDLYQAFLPR
jgi:hypothetical protein